MVRKKHRDVFDLECYPNFFSAICKDSITKKYKKFVVFADTINDERSINDAAAFIDFVEKEIEWFIGYNNHEYDDLLIKYLGQQQARLRISHPRKICEEIYKISSMIIVGQRTDKKDPYLYTLGNAHVQWRSLDLIQLFNPIDRVGLKRVAISLRWPRIEDLPYKPGSIILHDQVETIVSYQYNDVDMTERVMQEMSENINNRIAYTVKYGTDIINSSNSAIGRRMLADLYEKHTGIPYSQFKNLTTEYSSIRLADCVTDDIHFTTPEYNKVLTRVLETSINPNIKEKKTKKTKPQLNVKVRSKYLEHKMGLGGMHSEGPAEIMEENELYMYWDIDVQGYYPRLWCNHKLCPAHLEKIFVNLFEEHVVNARTIIKKSEPVLAYILKIAANAGFGLTDVKGEAKSWLKDPKVAKTITISGQLYLMMLMEGLEKYTKSIVVYSNTDGLTVRVLRTQEKLFRDLCARWELFTGFTLEYVKYRKMILRDVNNYLIFTDDPDKPIKAIGAYVFENTMAKDLKIKGFAYPIIAMAVRHYYDKGKPVEETIQSHDSIYDFMKAENTSPLKFDTILYHRNQKFEDAHLQKNNRWIVTKNNPKEGRILKISKETGERSEMQKGYLVTSVNNVDENTPIADYFLNYDFYIMQAKTLINLTIPLDKETHHRNEMEQTKLF